MIELRDRKCAQHYGEDVWARADGKTKACFNFLCGNHTRNLPTVRYNKVPLPAILTQLLCLDLLPHNIPVPYPHSQIYDNWLQNELGEQMRLAKAACGKPSTLS